MAKQIRRVRPPVRPFADSLTRALAEQIERDFGAFVPPFALHASAPSVLAACWAILREALVRGHVDRRRKEAVAAAVSRANACTYCVDAHTAAMHALGDTAAADALAMPGRRLGDGDRLTELVAWAEATRTVDDPRLGAPPFTGAEAPEITAIAFAFHYINRMVAIFLAPSPLPFTSPRLKALTRRMLGPILGGQLRRELTPGDSLAFLPDAALPADFAWTGGQTTLAAAFARAAAAIEAAGAAVLAPSLRARVQTTVAAWRGADMPLDTRWLVDATASLDAPERPAARLALLAALAPHRVDDALIADFRRDHPSDTDLIAATAWAAFTAARAIASRISAARVA